MKKRNWLMTIAFAVLSLTIVSTMVIGTTYAKFTSTISGNSTVRAAGFLITGSTASVAENLLIAPGKTENVQIELKYFSQVDTEIASSALQTVTSGNTGAFADANWALIVGYYNDNYAALKTYFGITYAAATGVIPGGDAAFTANSGTNPTVANLISVNGAAMVSTFLQKISDNNDTTGLDDAALAVDQTNHLVKAMAYDVTDPVTVALTIPVTWTTHAVGGDTFDTLVGNCIAALAAPNAGYAGVSITGTTVSIWLDLDGDGADTNSDETLELTVPTANTGIASKVSVALGMTATQYTGATTPTWSQPTDGGVAAS